MYTFHNKTVLITGGARGIGRAAAQAFAQQGARVAIADVDAEGAREAAAALPDAIALTCDVADPQQVESTVAAVLARYKTLDVLFNNAGINRRIPLNDWTPDDIAALLSVNLSGMFLMARAAGRHMTARRAGAIVNMSALGGGLIGLGRGTAVYTATKGGVAALSRDLAAEYAPFNVRVNCVAPGWIETDMNAPLLANPALAQRVIERVPLGRWGAVDDVVGPVLFLASDAARYITGHLLPIDGGANNIIRLTP